MGLVGWCAGSFRKVGMEETPSCWNWWLGKELSLCGEQLLHMPGHNYLDRAPHLALSIYPGGMFKIFKNWLALSLTNQYGH